jgi:hypothetical protein
MSSSTPPKPSPWFGILQWLVQPLSWIVVFWWVLRPRSDSPIGRLAPDNYEFVIPVASLALVMTVYALLARLYRSARSKPVLREAVLLIYPAFAGALVASHYEWAAFDFNKSLADLGYVVALAVLWVLAVNLQLCYRIPAFTRALEKALRDPGLIEWSRPSSVALVFDVLTLSLLFAATEMSGLTAATVSALAPLTAAFSVFFYIRTFRLCDELHRRIYVDALSLSTLVIALGAVLSASWMKPLIVGSAPHHWVMAIYVVFIACVIVATMRRTPEVFTEEFGGEAVEP